MSELVDFYRGVITDHQERTLTDLWNYSDDEMEMHHDFIQWMFPTREASRFNPEAPLIFDADVAEFQKDPELKANLIKSLDRFLAFLGLVRVDGKVERAPDYDSKKWIWSEPDHNWMRVTRVLHCLVAFKLEDEARAFFDRLQKIKNSEGAGITPEAYRYWQHAARVGSD